MQLDGERLKSDEPAAAAKTKAVEKAVLSAEEAAEKAARKKAEEHEKWWSFARNARGQTDDAPEKSLEQQSSKRMYHDK